MSAFLLVTITSGEGDEKGGERWGGLVKCGGGGESNDPMEQLRHLSAITVITAFSTP